MKKYDIRIPLSEENIKLMLRSFEDGYEVYRHKKSDYPTKINNGYQFDIWNHVFEELYKNFSKDGFRACIIKRGKLWSFVSIYDEKNKYLFTFMRSGNYKELQKKDVDKVLAHYAGLFGRLNRPLLSTYSPLEQQLEFDVIKNMSKEDNDKYRMRLEDMLAEIDGEVERYVVVLVDQMFENVHDIKAVIPIETLDNMYVESWRDYIKANYASEQIVTEEPMGEPNESNIRLFSKKSKIELEKKRTEEEKLEE